MFRINLPTSKLFKPKTTPTVYLKRGMVTEVRGLVKGLLNAFMLLFQERSK